MAYCACTNGGPDPGQLPRSGAPRHRAGAEPRAGSRRGKETGSTITPCPTHDEKIARPWRRAEPPKPRRNVWDP